MNKAMDGRRLTTGLVLALMTVNAWAGTQVRLTPVWSRVADINGEYGSIESAEFSPDGNRIVSGSKFDNQVIMWRTSDGMELWRATVAQVNRIVPSEMEKVRNMRSPTISLTGLIVSMERPMFP